MQLLILQLMNNVFGFFKIILKKFFTFFLSKDIEEVYLNKAKRLGIKFGQGCRFYSTNFSTEPYLIQLGDHVTITEGVRFITHDGGVWIYREEFPNIELFGSINIGNNVFVGLNAIILLNTDIGDNCIVAAGAVVKGKFESNSIIGGIPAKVIGSTKDYYAKNLKNFTFIRNLSPNEKKIFILNKFNKSESCNNK